MKKLLFIAVAAITMGFASCSENKSDDAAAVIENLKAQLESGDAAAVQSTLEGAKAKIAELVAKDPEAAKTYVVKIQDFVKENKEKITAVVGDNIVAQGLVTTLVETPAETVINTLTAGQSVIDSAKSTAEGLKDSIDQAVSNKIEEVQTGVEDAVNQQVESAKQQAADKVNEEVNKAADKANEEINKAADKALKSMGL